MKEIRQKIAIARSFTEDELRKALSAPEFMDGFWIFISARCDHCRKQVNILVVQRRSRQTCDWTCDCGGVNSRPEGQDYSTPWSQADIGPSRAEVNRILCQLGVPALN